MTEFAFIELTSNKAVEDAAIAFVLDYERQQGRSARDTRGQRQPADVSSDGRIIAVKAYGRSARSTDPWRTHLHTVAVLFGLRPCSQVPGNVRCLAVRVEE